jgi:DNA-binding transcriptional regulator YiaG
MKGEEVRRIRERLGLSREEFAEVFGLSGYRTVMNIETDFRRPSKLTIILLRVLDSLSESKALVILDLLRRHSDV